MKHAGKYFEIHAKQRMSVFNFFVIMFGSFSAGLAATFQGPKKYSAVGVVIGIVLMFLAFIFWKLDQRVRFLIKHAEAVLVSAEEQSIPEPQRLFANEVSITAGKARGPAYFRMWTYGSSFRFVFIIAALIGFAGSFISALRLNGTVNLN
jgi:hypothetical protein